MIRGLNGKRPKIAKSAFISEGAYVVGDVEIGERSSVWPGAVIRGDFGRIVIGRDTAVEDNCVIHSGTLFGPSDDVFIGDQVIIGHGAVLNLHRIGHNVLIGINATLLHDATIGNFCIVAAASLVGQAMKIPDFSLVRGAPAKIIGKPTEKQLAWVKGGGKKYNELVNRYKAEGL